MLSQDLASLLLAGEPVMGKDKFVCLGTKTMHKVNFSMFVFSYKNTGIFFINYSGSYWEETREYCIYLPKGGGDLLCNILYMYFAMTYISTALKTLIC